MRFIQSRPKSVLNRRRYGHWERDCIHAKNGRLMLVLLERKSRFVRLSRLQPRTSESAARATKKLLRHVGLPVLSITNDNGRELYDGDRFQVPVYYCDPMKPQQRGSVENVNRLLRRYIQRDTDLDRLSGRDIRRIERALNDRPKKCLGYRTPREVRSEYLRKLH